MNEHNICRCVVASMLSITATAWAQKQVLVSPLDNTEPGDLARPHSSVNSSNSIFSIRFSPFEWGCHALSGPRCYAVVGKGPGE
jgi:hypothetical protein